MSKLKGPETMKRNLTAWKGGAFREIAGERIDARCLPETPEEFRQLRRELNLSQAELAERLKVSKEAIASWEQGKRPISGLAAVALAYMHTAIYCNVESILSIRINDRVAEAEERKARSDRAAARRRGPAPVIALRRGGAHGN